jgi:hypothetical protein
MDSHLAALNGSANARITRKREVGRARLPRDPSVAGDCSRSSAGRLRGKTGQQLLHQNWPSVLPDPRKHIAAIDDMIPVGELEERS